MPSFTGVSAGVRALALHVQQIIDAWQGVPNKGVPMSLTAVSDPLVYTLQVRNLGTGSKGLLVLNAAGTTILSVDGTGVKASPDGALAAGPVLANVTGVAIDAPIISNVTLNGTVSGTAVGTGATQVAAGNHSHPASPSETWDIWRVSATAPTSTNGTDGVNTFVIGAGTGTATTKVDVMVNGIIKVQGVHFDHTSGAASVVFIAGYHPRSGDQVAMKPRLT